MQKPVKQAVATRNIISAQTLVNRLQMPWLVIWEKASFVFNGDDTYSKMLHDLVKLEKLFRCVYCGKPLTWMELSYNPKALDDREYVDTLRCFHDKDTKPLIPNVEQRSAMTEDEAFNMATGTKPTPDEQRETCFAQNLVSAVIDAPSPAEMQALDDEQARFDERTI